jgi:hypothetical protein
LEVMFSRLLAKNALSVAASAIVPLAGGSAVYVVEEGKALLKPVQTGLRCGGRVEISGGLEAGDIVVANPYDAGVKAGSRVKVEAGR